jgi:hypothetical protein
MQNFDEWKADKNIRKIAIIFKWKDNKNEKKFEEKFSVSIDVDEQNISFRS